MTKTRINITTLKNLPTSTIHFNDLEFTWRQCWRRSGINPESVQDIVHTTAERCWGTRIPHGSIRISSMRTTMWSITQLLESTSTVSITRMIHPLQYQKECCLMYKKFMARETCMRKMHENGSKKRHEWHDAFLTSSQSQCRRPIIRAKNKRALGAFYPPVISARLC